MRAAAFSLLLAACGSEVRPLVVPADVETAIVLTPGETWLWTRDAGEASVRIVDEPELAVEVLYFAETAEVLGLAKDSDGHLVVASTSDTWPLPPAKRGARYDPVTGTFSGTNGTSALAALVRVDAPACGGFRVASGHMVGNGLLGGQRIFRTAAIGEVALLGVRSRMPPTLTPRAIRFEGDTARIMVLSATVAPGGFLNPLSDGGSFLLTYSSARAFEVYRVTLDGTATRLHSDTSGAYDLEAFAHWPGSNTIYAVEVATQRLIAFDLTTLELRVVASGERGVALVCNSSSPFVTLEGPDEGVVSLDGDLPLRFDAAGVLRPVIIDLPPTRACDSRYARFADGTELVSHRAGPLEGNVGRLISWRASEGSPWRRAPASGLYTRFTHVGDALVAQDRDAQEAVRLSYTPGRSDQPPRVCATLDTPAAVAVAQVATDGTHGVAVTEYVIDGFPPSVNLIRFTLDAP